MAEDINGRSLHIAWCINAHNSPCPVKKHMHVVF